MSSAGRGPSTRRTSRPSSRRSVAKSSTSPRRRWRRSTRRRFRPFGFDDSVRLRPVGALRRPPPEDLHQSVGPADPAPRLLPLHRLPPGKLSARPGAGSAGHLAVARHDAAGGTGGDERQLRRSERVAGGTGRRGGRPQAGRAHCRSAGPRSRGRRTRDRRARSRRGADDVSGAGRYRRTGAQVRGGRPARQAARRGGQDP